MWVPGAPHLEPGLEVGHVGECLVARISPTEPGGAQTEEDTWVPLPIGSPFVEEAKGVGSRVWWVVAEGGWGGGGGINFGGLWIEFLLFADDVVLLASSVRDLPLLLERFAAECEAAGMRISSSKSETMVLSQKRGECLLRDRDEVLPQVEEIKYLGVLFTSERKIAKECEIDRQIGAAVMRELCQSVVLKRQLSRKAFGHPGGARSRPAAPPH
nr:uncharacterized protein LOC129153661 [Nothobranchius furzeri]